MLGGVISMTIAADEVAALYDATYRRLVGQLTLATGSRADAEECVQEAFARLLVRWDKVGHYEQPEAWVRLVAFHLAMNRRRRLMNEAKALLRLRATREPVGEQGPGEPGIAQSMRALAPAHRAVLVLHYVIGLDIAEMADILGVPQGTVKSRLARARERLRSILDLEATHG